MLKHLLRDKTGFIAQERVFGALFKGDFSPPYQARVYGEIAKVMYKPLIPSAYSM